MTSHELAQRLLEGPDLPIGAWTYTGGNTPLLDITGVSLCQDTDVLAVTVDYNSELA